MIWNKDRFLTNAGLKKIDMKDFGGGEVYIKKITLGDRNDFVDKFHGTEEKGTKEIMKSIPALVKITICNEKGNLLLSDISDEEFSKIDADLIDFLYKEASAYNKLIDEKAITNEAKKS